MFEGSKRKLSKSEHIQNLLYKSYKVCKKISTKEPVLSSIYEYVHFVDEAIEELGVEEEIIHQLIEDYVVQIITTQTTFEEYLGDLEELKLQNKELDYTPFRELAHKNLGVARNLRIKDAEKILTELMKKEDISYLKYCLEALVACAIRLKPSRAYATIKLLAIKKSLEKPI